MSKSNRAARTRASQQNPSVVAPQAPRVPALKTILYVYENGHIITGAPDKLKLVQAEDGIELIHVVAQEGDNYTFARVCAFKGSKIA